jgi:hypothetical protein
MPPTHSTQYPEGEADRLAFNIDKTGRPGRFFRWLRGARGRSVRIALIYMLAGSAWIVFTDLFAMELSRDTLGVFQLSVVKGLVYVAVSALWCMGRSARSSAPRRPSSG